MPNEPPSATNPLAISSHDIPLNEVNAFPRIVIAAATPIRPMALTIMPLGIRFIAPTIISNAPPIAARPLAISSHDIRLMSFITLANIFIAAAMAINATPVDKTCLALPARLVNATSSRSKPPIPARPLPMSSHFIVEKSLQTDANILSAAAIITIPVAVETALPPNLAVFKNSDISANKTAIPARPLANPSQLSSERSLQTDASILSAAAIITI